MILRSLAVENFRGLRAAHLTFGRGLNVLYGPNDLGKSTLAEALRVAFLLPATSTACQELIPWGTASIPRVVVRFELRDVVWQITKTFGMGTRGTSLLEQVGERGSLREEAKGRAVEEKLREIIAWGVPAPGGKGAPRGLPQSYLATALVGRQDDVTAILNASFEEDGAKSGLELVTKALGALGQHPLVSRLLQRLEERTQEVYTPTGQLRRGADSRLVQLAAQVEERQRRLQELAERIGRGTEIEKTVRRLGEDRVLAIQECCRLERRVEILSKVMKAEEALEGVRANKRSMDEGRCTLAAAAEDLRTKEQEHEQAALALSKLDEQLQAARERLAKLSGGRDQLREDRQSTHEARRAELVARRDAAAGRSQAARELIRAREQVGLRERELALAKEEHMRAQQAELRSVDLAELAGLLEETEQAHAIVEGLRAATKQRDETARRVTEAEAELKRAEAALEDVVAAAGAQKDALATAQRERSQRDLRKETLRASLIRAETAEREAIDDLARARAALDCAARLAEAERGLADLERVQGDIESKLSVNTAERQAREAERAVSMPLPIQVPLLVGFLAGAIATALGIASGPSGAVLAVSVVGSALLAAGIAAFIVRHRGRSEAIASLRRDVDELARVREELLERRNQAVAKYGVAQVRRDSARLERDRAASLVRAPEAALPTAESRLQEARSELESIRKELATFERLQPGDEAACTAQVESAEQAAALLKERIGERRQTLDEARRQSALAQVRFEAARSSAASVDLAGLEQRVNASRMETHAKEVPSLEVAQAQLQLARQTAAERETAMKVAEGRLSDARSTFDGMANAFEQPAVEVLAESEKTREDSDIALQRLEETLSSEVAAAEKDLLEAKDDVARQAQQQATAQAEAEAAALARNQALTKHEQARAKLEALLSLAPEANVADAEAALVAVRTELESDRDGSSDWPESLATVEALLEQRQAELRRTEDALQEARGQLKFVGGAIERDQHDQESQALDHLRKSTDDLELEYKAARRLLDVLKEEELKQAAHLGRSLARPVTEIFSEFTSSRYSQVVLDSGLRFRSVMAAGHEREPASLSVGTRDQLATLVRLALAAHLKSVIVLDDQLAHSDPRCLAWFRDRLRSSVRDHEHQIIVITCRPLDYLRPEEIPATPNNTLQTEDERLTVMDLGQVTSRWRSSRN